jgi:hypothetical protein
MIMLLLTKSLGLIIKEATNKIRLEKKINERTSDEQNQTKEK